MIYTVTANPSLDHWMELDQFQMGRTNRCQKSTLMAGGKGLNVTRVLHNLHMDSMALGFVAGFVGDEIVRQVEKSGCLCRLIRLTEGCSRINVKLQCTLNDREETILGYGGEYDTTELNTAGPQIPADAMAALTEQLEQLESGDYLVLAGSVPSGASSALYADWMARLYGKDISVVVDASGEMLLRTLSYHPFLVKPNHHELGELFGVTINGIEKAIFYGKQLQAQGARNVLVSMSKDGAVLCCENGAVYTQAAAKGKTVVNDVGAGDSMIAGFLTGWIRTGDYRKALRYGAATGAATAFSKGLATKQEVERILAELEERT